MKIGKKICLVLIAAAVLTVMLFYGNETIICERITVENDSLPEKFNDFKIVQVSDLHNRSFGKNNARLIVRIENEQPDIIVITGDLIDCNRTQIETAVAFAEELDKIAPTYYVPGNHEAALEYSAVIKPELRKAGVEVLENESSRIYVNDQYIVLSGILDPTFSFEYYTKKDEVILDEEIRSLSLKEEDFNILLSHRPEAFSVYVTNDIDLTFTGHAHGGQFRLPVIGGIYSPNQGFFPKYDSGLYVSQDNYMCVSRGLGNSVIRIRLGNPPHLVSVTLKK